MNKEDKDYLKDLLDEAKAQITDVKAELHGDAGGLFNYIAALWSSYLGTKVDANDVAHCQTLLKIARSAFGTHNRDDYVDAIGYQGLAAALDSRKGK